MFEFILLALSATFIGMGKGGIPGAGMLTIPIYAALLGAKPSTGFILPLLIFADINAILYYRKNTQWKHLTQLLPWVLIGIGFAVIMGSAISEAIFKIVLACVIFTGVILLLIKDYIKISPIIFKNKWFNVTMGILGGFSSMIGNAAGPIMSIFLLSIDLEKEKFIATRAWFFFMINLIKLPFHIFVWETICLHTLVENLKLLPFIFIGILIAYKIVRLINENLFKKIVLTIILASVILLAI